MISVYKLCQVWVLIYCRNYIITPEKVFLKVYCFDLMYVKYMYNFNANACVNAYFNKKIHLITFETRKNKRFYVSKLCQVTAGSSK